MTAAWRGLPAWHLAGGGLEAEVGVIGAPILSLRRADAGADGEALWQPPWPTDTAFAGDPRSEDRLLAVTGGWMLCLDRFGAPGADEDRPFHGEAGVLPWRAELVAADAIELAIKLPTAGLVLRRSVRLAGGACLVSTSVRADDGRARTFDWCEHLTLGDPFLDGAAISAGIDHVESDGGRRAGTDPALIAAALAMPAAGDPPRGDLWSGRVAAPWWRAEHPRLGRLTATWQADEFPWLAVWTDHRANHGAPWLGRNRSRGLELSTKPFPRPGLWPAADHRGRPARCLLPAGSELRRSVRLAWD